MRILVVDDESRTRKTLMGIIQGCDPAFVVNEARNGSEALAMIEAEAYDIVFCDIRMPQMDGLEMIERSREGTSTHTRYVIVSGYGEFSFAQRAMSLRVMDFVLKPIDAEIIATCVKKLAVEIQVERAKIIEWRRMEREAEIVKATQMLSDGYDGNRDRVQDAIKDQSRAAIEKCVQTLREGNLAEITLTKVAERYHFNASYFSSLFKRYTGATFLDYVTALRLERAKEMLEDSGYKVYQISRMVGFKDVKYFARLFKQRFGLTPEEYRFVSKNRIQ